MIDSGLASGPMSSYWMMPAASLAAVYAKMSRPWKVWDSPDFGRRFFCSSMTRTFVMVV